MNREDPTNSDPLNIETFARWYRESGHWIYDSREHALHTWTTRGIDGLPAPQFTEASRG